MSAAAPTPAGSPNPVDLTRLPAGSEGRLSGTRLARADLEILEGLGLTDACRLRVCQTGDPCIVQVRATKIGIAEPLARAIFVLPE
jgi:hypothetical protein